MSNLDKDLVVHQVIALMDSYSFDTNRQNLQQLVQKWLVNYNINWIYLATIEALYLGRYKTVSVEQILHGWSRIGQPKTHFGGDFERLVSRKLPRHFSLSDSPLKSKKDLALKESKPDSIADNPENPSSNGNCSEATRAEESDDLTEQETIPPLPEAKITAPPTQKQLSKKDSSESKKPSNKRIVTFQPNPDGSEFFKKLKALADSQRDKTELDDFDIDYKNR